MIHLLRYEASTFGSTCVISLTKFKDFCADNIHSLKGIKHIDYVEVMPQPPEWSHDYQAYWLTLLDHRAEIIRRMQL